MVEVASSGHAEVAPALRFDQIGALYELVKAPEHRRLTPAQGLDRLQEVCRLQPTFGWLIRTLGHAVLTPLVLWIERLRRGPPKLVAFLPAFWLVVPGALGLIGVTQIVGTGTQVAAGAFRDTLGTIIAISPGVLIGAAAHKTTDAGARYLGRAVRGARSTADG